MAAVLDFGVKEGWLGLEVIERPRAAVGGWCAYCDVRRPPLVEAAHLQPAREFPGGGWIR